jgi:hypothetical protein
MPTRPQPQAADATQGFLQRDRIDGGPALMQIEHRSIDHPVGFAIEIIRPQQRLSPGERLRLFSEHRLRVSITENGCAFEQDRSEYRLLGLKIVRWNVTENVGH